MELDLDDEAEVGYINKLFLFLCNTCEVRSCSEPVLQIRTPSRGGISDFKLKGCQ